MSPDRDVAAERWEGHERLLYASLVAALVVDVALLLHAVTPALRPIAGGLALSAGIVICALLLPVLFAAFAASFRRIAAATSE